MRAQVWRTSLLCLLLLMVYGLVYPKQLLAPPVETTVPEMHRFRVEIDGIVAAGFESVQGLGSAISVIEYRDGISRTTMKLPGRTKCSNIILRGTPANTRELWEWHRSILEGNMDKRDMAVILMDSRGEEVARYGIRAAWPCAWRGPELSASISSAALEEIELAIEDIRRMEVRGPGDVR